jgi:pimeloyl-ACP methyl ester carboxylesterase
MTRRSGEALVFTAAVALALVHALDDAFLHRGPGLGVGQHALAGLVAVAGGSAAVLAFPSLRAGLRAALAFSFGGFALVNGTLHAIHVSEHGAAGADVTGLLAVAAGAVLIGLAVAIPWRARGEGTWKSRSVAAPAGSLGLLLMLGPIALGIVATHKWREPVGAPPSAAYRDVAFDATDGLELRGWYRPSRNGAAVLVVHGGSSDRKGSVAHAEMLADHGYGVLLYDARGRGDSDGSENNYGWDWAKDIEGALGFLHEREGIDRIGAVGLSTGADVLLEVAAERDDLAAVVADGAAAGSFRDWQNLRGTELGALPGFVMFSTIRVLSGDAPGTPLMDAVRRIEEPTLLISAGAADERDANVRYDAVAGGAVEHWNLPDAEHTRAIRTDREAYERRVVGFLNAALR